MAQTESKMTDMQRMILDELLCKPKLLKGSGVFASNNVYMQVINTGYNHMKDGDFYIQEAGACGGAWWVIGTGHVHDDHVVLELNTVHGIMFYRSETEQMTFQLCVPGFPDNVNLVIEKAVLNARRARNLEIRRSGQKRRRRFRKERLTREAASQH